MVVLTLKMMESVCRFGWWHKIGDRLCCWSFCTNFKYCCWGTKNKNHVFLEFCSFGSTNSPEFLNEV
jgi:hypothetical protein